MQLIDKARELIKGQEYDREGNSRKCYFVNIDGRDYALLVYPCDNKEENTVRLQATCDLVEQGLDTPHLIGIDYEDGMAYEIQERVMGKTFAYRTPSRCGGEEIFMTDFIYSLKILDNADKSAFLGLLNDARIYYINGYDLDCHPDNFLIDKEGNFTLIDLDIYDMPKKREDKFYLYCNALPYIISHVVSIFLKEDSKYYDEIRVLLRSIGHKWFEMCVEYLAMYDFEAPEMRQIINRISFNYFLMDQAEIDHMIYSHFSDDRVILG